MIGMTLIFEQRAKQRIFIMVLIKPKRGRKNYRNNHNSCQPYIKKMYGIQCARLFEKNVI